MIRKIVFVIIVLNSISNYGQKDVLLKTKFKPNKSYSIHMNSMSFTEGDIIADKEIIDKMKNEGIVLPIIAESVKSWSVDLVTKKINKNGEFNGIMNYQQTISNTTINGNISADKEPLVSVKLIVKYDDENKFTLDSIIGEKISQKVKNGINSTLDSIHNIIKFPERNLKVGESFNMDIPITIEVAGKKPISLIIDTEYFLIEIKNKKAFFEIKQTVGLDTSMKQSFVKVSGTGTGKSVFDIRIHQLTIYESELPMNLTIKMNPKMTMTMKMKTTYEQYIKMN